MGNAIYLLFLILPPAIRLTVSRTWRARTCRLTTDRSKCPVVSVLLALTHRMKCGLAWTSVRNRLSSRVWKSCVNVDTGSSPFNLHPSFQLMTKAKHFKKRDKRNNNKNRVVTHKSVCDVGEIRKRMPLGAVSWANSTLSSEPNRWVAKPNWQLCL